MAKKTSYALKQLIPEENPKTGTKYIVRKPTKGMKVAEFSTGSLLQLPDKKPRKKRRCDCRNKM